MDETLTPENTAEDAPEAPQMEDQKTIEELQQELLDALADLRLDKIDVRVAWLLNNYAACRDSDTELALSYWETFEDLDRRISTLDSLQGATKFTSIERARRTVQNKLKLFQATENVRRFRGQLSEEEKAKSISKTASAPSISVFADETGKNAPFLIAAGLWCLETYSERILGKELELWKNLNEISEFHFVEISKGNLHKYLELIDYLAEPGRFNFFGFKFIAQPSVGVGSGPDSFGRLFYHLVAKGIEHEHASGRAALPRRLTFLKDKESDGQDTALLLDLDDRLKNAALGRFDGNLEIGFLHVADSKANVLIQLADLFAGSVNRVLNQPGSGSGDHPKDVFAAKLLQVFGIDLQATETLDDVAYRLHI